MFRRVWLVLLLMCAGIYLPADSIVLKGQIEHSDKLEPVNQALAPGAVFDEKNLGPLPDPTEANRWYKVPGWLAGSWHKDSQTDYYRYDFVNKSTDIATHVTEARSDGRWGTQQDPQGQVWQFDPAPFVTRVDAGDEMVVQLVSHSDPIDSSDQQFIRRSIDTQVRVDKQTNVIRTVECGEQITSYLPEIEGLVKRESSSKVFDRFGQPMILGKSFSYEKLIAPFAPQDEYKGKDLRELFKQFLDKQSSF
jgi:hypothetical protein